LFRQKPAEILNPAHAPRRTKRLGQDIAMLINTFVGITDIDAPTMTIAEILLDLAMVVGNIDHDVGNTVPGQMFDQVFHHRLAENGNHRLGQILGQRPNASPLTGRENHSFCHHISLIYLIY
jgi:hypothetical protein